MLTELNIAVVGHANVGKTSLLRTLTSDSQFGEVQDKPGTTKHVESITFSLTQNEGKTRKIIFHDTPGLEDSITLYDYIHRINQDNIKRDGIEQLERFLKSPEAHQQFEQEAKVIRQLLKSDVAIYVIDIREPVLDKYHDELAVLALGDKPILALLNFTASQSGYESDWKTLLSRVGIHTSVRFDALFPSIDGEARLYQSLVLLTESAHSILSLWQEKIKEQRTQRIETARKIIATALVDVTSYTEVASDKTKKNVALEMQNSVRLLEQKTIKSLLKLYQFSSNYESESGLPIIDGRFESDLFNKEALKLMGIHLSKGLATGAAIGAGIDLAVGGITLGSAALIGASIGGTMQVAKNYGSRLKNYFSGLHKMTIDDSVICFLSLRLIKLVESLNARSHANTDSILLPEIDKQNWQKGKLPKSLEIARVYPKWSSINHRNSNSDHKQEIIDNVAEELR